MPAASKSVAYALDTSTVHVKVHSAPTKSPDGSEVWDIESKMLLPGETMPLSDMPPYLSEAIKSGKVPSLRAITEAQAKKVAKFREAALEAGNAFTEMEIQEDDPNFPAEEY